MDRKQFKRIWHIGAWNRNIGDWTAGFNLHRMLEEQALDREMALSFYLVDSQRSLFHDALIDQLNEEADLLLIGAGGMIFNRPQDESQSGWAFNISAEKLREIKVPIVVYGIGYNKFQYDKVIWPDYMGEHLRTLQNCANIFSVRNKGSKMMLKENFGLDTESIDIIPDPGMKLYDRHIEVPGVKKEGPMIVVNWAGDRPNERFQEPWEETRTYFIEELRKALIKTVENLKARILFVPHLEDVDVDFFDELKIGFSEKTIFSAKEKLPYLYPPAGEMLYYNVPFMTNLYRQADLVLGMRGHSCIFSFGAGTKFIPFGSHNKVRYFTEDVGVPLYPIRMMDPKKEDENTMYETMTNCLNDSRWEQDYPKLMSEQFDRLHKANEKVIDLL